MDDAFCFGGEGRNGLGWVGLVWVSMVVRLVGRGFEVWWLFKSECEGLWREEEDDCGGLLWFTRYGLEWFVNGLGIRCFESCKKFRRCFVVVHASLP